MRYFKLSAASAAAALTLMASTAQASDGTINFAGSLVSATCAIGGAGATQTVTLPTLSASALSAGSPVAGPTPFSIAVTGCPTGAGAPTTFATYFEGVNSANVDAATGRLKNTAGAGAALGAQLRLSNASGTVIDLSKPSTTQGSASVTLSGGAGTANYIVEYYGTSATAGSVQSSITYSVVYN